MNTNKERAILRDALRHAQFDLRPDVDGMGLYGFGVAALRDGDGRLSLVVPFSNRINDLGDAFIAKKIGDGVHSQTISYTNPNGMKLGTASVAVTKNGAGSWIAASADYISGSNVLFDTGYPTATIVSAGNGWTTNFQTVWAAGVASNGAIYSAEICTDQATNAGHTALDATYARTVFTSPINKTSADSLTVTWKWTANGA